MNYRQLQSALKELKATGADVQVKLTASFDTLQAEYDRLTAIATQVSPEPLQVQSSQQLEPPREVLLMTADEFNLWVGLPTEPVTAIAEAPIQAQPKPPIPLPQEHSPEPILNLTPIAKPSLGDTQELTGHHQEPSHWIDGTELGQHLDLTQAQALRNLENGLSWLRGLARNIKAFGEGFRDGWREVGRRQQARSRQPSVIPLTRSKHCQSTAMAA